MAPDRGCCASRHEPPAPQQVSLHAKEAFLEALGVAKVFQARYDQNFSTAAVPRRCRRPRSKSTATAVKPCPPPHAAYNVNDDAGS